MCRHHVTILPSIDLLVAFRNSGVGVDGETRRRDQLTLLPWHFPLLRKISHKFSRIIPQFFPARASSRLSVISVLCLTSQLHLNGSQFIPGFFFYLIYWFRYPWRSILNIFSSSRGLPARLDGRILFYFLRAGFRWIFNSTGDLFCVELLWWTEHRLRCCWGAKPCGIAG